MSTFIFMLTRDDVTIPDAIARYRETVGTGVEHVGFKDVGLPREAMRELVDAIHDDGRTAHLEVVSLTAEDELRSARTAVELGVDYLIGGTQHDQVAPLLQGTGIRYFPYVGAIDGRPARLFGEPDDLVRQARSLQGAVDGINLLAFRHVSADPLDLLRRLCSASDLPVICAGSIDSDERVRQVAATGAWAFTVGTAALDGAFDAAPDLPSQLRAVIAAASESRDSADV